MIPLQEDAFLVLQLRAQTAEMPSVVVWVYHYVTLDKLQQLIAAIIFRVITKSFNWLNEKIIV